MAQRPPPPPPLPSGFDSTSRIDSTDNRSERATVVDEAVAESLAHVVTEYIKQDIDEARAMETGEVPPDVAAEAALRDGLHFTAGKFRYNWRLVPLLAAAGVGIMPVLGSNTITVFICSTISIYIADYLNYKKGTIVVILTALMALWCSMFATNIVDLTRSSDAMLLIVSISCLLAVVAAWAILQFRWVQVSFPEVVVLLERLVLGVAPVASMPSIFSMIVGVVGAKNAPFPFAALLCVLHWFFYRRLRSSYVHTLNEKLKDQTYCTGEEEAITFTAFTVLAPPAAYIALHNSFDFSVNLPLHMFNMVGLFSISLVYFVWNIRATGWFLFRHERFRTISEAMNNTAKRSKLAGARLPLAIFGYTALLHTLVFRLTRSRYGYLFSGIAPPFNELILCFACYCYSFTGIMMIRLTRPFENPKTRIICWLGAICLSTIGTVFLGLVAGMPQFFIPMSALSVAAFSAFILDPRQANNFMMFLFSSMLLLLWWMYRTFSFIRQDLHVLGEATSISTQAVAVSVLWAYILGALAFACSLTKSNTMLVVCLALHGFKVTWVEHVLYSQRDEGAYPPFFTFATSGLGMAMAYRLYKNEVLSKDAAAGIGAMYVGKLGSWLYDVTAWRYSEINSTDPNDNNAFVLFAIESTLVYWCLAAGVWLMIVTTRSKLQVGTIFVYTSVFAACMRNAVVRWCIDFAWHDPEPGVFRTIGGCLILYALMVFPLAQASQGADMTIFKKLASVPFMLGVTLLLFDPSLEFVIGGGDQDDGDLAVRVPLWSRVSGFSTVVLLCLARFIPFSKGPRAARIIFWMILCTLAALACVGTVLPIADVKVVLFLVVFFVCAGITVEISHYTKADGDNWYAVWILYACSVASMALAWVASNSIDVSSITTIEVYIWELISTNRHGLMALSGVVNLLMAVMLKARLTGMPLLPGSVAMTHTSVMFVGCVANYCTLLAYVIFCMLNLSSGDGSLPMYVASSTFLLLLQDDGIILPGLSMGSLRYIPPIVGAWGPLWGTVILEAFATAKIPLWRRIWHVGTAGTLLPSQLSLLAMLWFGSKRGGSSRALLAICCALDLLLVLVHTSPAVRWMAVVNLVAHGCRAFAAALWQQRSAVLL